MISSINSSYISNWASHSATPDSSTPEANLVHSSQLPLPASSARFSELVLAPELAEVQKGTIVLPSKSFCETKLDTGQAATPHQIG